MKQKIICLIESLISGGAERQLTYLATFLNNKEYDVEVWAYYPNDFYLPYLKENGVKYRYIKEAQPLMKRIPVLLKELMKASPDVLIAYLDVSCMVACLFKILNPKTTIITSERNTTQVLNRKERVKFFLLRFADYVVPNSYSQGRFISKHYPNLNKKIRVITNYIDVEKFSRKHDYESYDMTRIIVVGRVMPQKNPLRFMDAVAILKDKGYKFNITWYGEPEEANYGKLCKEKFDSLGIADVLTFKAPDSNIVERYNENEVFCLPSTYEGFPNVICEAMSCCLPVLCSNVCDNPDIIVDGKCGFFFNPEDVNSIVVAFENFFNLNVEQKKMFSNNSRERVMEICSNEKFVNSYISLFK